MSGKRLHCRVVSCARSIITGGTLQRNSSQFKLSLLSKWGRIAPEGEWLPQRVRPVPELPVVAAMRDVPQEVIRGAVRVDDDRRCAPALPDFRTATGRIDMP